jgi:hypothetical protein
MTHSDLEASDARLNGLVLTDVRHVHESIDPRLETSRRPSLSKEDDRHTSSSVTAAGEVGKQKKDDNALTRVSTNEIPQSSGEKSEDQEQAIYVRPYLRIYQYKRERSLNLQIDWDDNDPRNPVNFSTARKWVITIFAATLTGLSGNRVATPLGTTIDSFEQLPPPLPMR